MSTEIKPSSERKCTNIPALVFAAVFIVITVILVTYCGIVATIKLKSIDLEDECGNVCGQLNIKTNSSACGDPDKRKFPKLLIEESDRDSEEMNLKCVQKCPYGYKDVMDVCFKFEGSHTGGRDINNDMERAVDVLKATWYYILIICFVALVFSYVFLILFRHAAKYVIWVINIGFVVVTFALAFVMLAIGSPPAAIVFGICGLFLIFMLCVFAKRISLVAKLFKEASKALIDVPSLMFEPILTFISLLISFLIFATFAVIVTLAGEDEPLAKPAHYCNIISFIFITQFIIGCQNFIIAGSIVRWYFTRDKTKVHKPIKKSFSHLFKFHLGSVCFGAILVTLVKLIKMLFTAIKNNAKQNKNGLIVLIATLLLCLVELLEELLSFLVRNAYVIIAKEGTPFCDSGKKAVKLLTDNIMDVIALNNFGDLVLFVCRLIVVMIAGFVGYVVIKQNTHGYGDFIAIPVIIGCIMAFLIAHCFVMVFEMTVDTIFISFCIDIEENDGDTKPFYMSESLKKIIDEMKEYSGRNNEPKGNEGIEAGMTDGSGIPMLPPQPQPIYPNLGYGDPNNPQQQPYPQYPPMPNMPYPPQPGMPYIQPAGVPYPEQPLMPPQGYPAPYPDQPYPQKY